MSDKINVIVFNSQNVKKGRVSGVKVSNSVCSNIRELEQFLATHLRKEINFDSYVVLGNETLNYIVKYKNRDIGKANLRRYEVIYECSTIEAIPDYFAGLEAGGSTPSRDSILAVEIRYKAVENY